MNGHKPIFCSPRSSRKHNHLLLILRSGQSDMKDSSDGSMDFSELQLPHERDIHDLHPALFASAEQNLMHFLTLH
eukprot:Skav205945  [mRNA]  locus=scaffold442:45961:46195:- [translate_table: standard]